MFTIEGFVHNIYTGLPLYKHYANATHNAAFWEFGNFSWEEQCVYKHQLPWLVSQQSILEVDYFCRKIIFRLSDFTN